MVKEKRALTTGQIAEFSGVHFRTVLRWIERGELKAYRLPGTRADHRVNVDDFLDFLGRHHMPVPRELKQERRALVVDDNPTDTKLFRAILEEAGFKTEVAENGFRAGALLTAFQPDIMTLDLQMEGLGGLDVIKMVKSMERFNHVKILVISAMNKSELEKAAAAGADAVLQKPVTHHFIMEKVNEILKGKTKRS